MSDTPSSWYGFYYEESSPKSVKKILGDLAREFAEDIRDCIDGVWRTVRRLVTYADNRPTIGDVPPPHVCGASGDSSIGDAHDLEESMLDLEGRPEFKVAMLKYLREYEQVPPRPVKPRGKPKSARRLFQEEEFSETTKPKKSRGQVEEIEMKEMGKKLPLVRLTKKTRR